MNGKEIRFIDLFAGIGGFRLGLERASPRFKCVYTNEWDKFSAAVYRKRFGECDCSDIRKVDASSVPAHELICGGFPCQAFSTAGSRKGFADTRGTLFHEILRIAAHHRTPYLLLENVKGLLTHDEGRTFSVILEAMDGLGYDVEWQVLDGSNRGSAQSRPRVYIFGCLRGTAKLPVFPLRKEAVNKPQMGEHLFREPFPTLNASYSGTMDDAVVMESEENFRPSKVKDMPDPKGFLRINGGIKEKADFVRVLGESMASQTSLSEQTPAAFTPAKFRLLTPVEAERLQGFSTGWTEGYAPSKRYKMTGNAVQINVVEAVGKAILEAIE